MNRSLFQFPLFSVLLLAFAAASLPAVVFASAPGVSLRVRSQTGATKMQITISPRSSAVGCTYEVFGGTSANNLNALKGANDPLIRLRGTASKRTVIASPLPAVKSRLRSVLLYFSAKTVCGSSSSSSARVGVAVRASRISGGSSAAFLRAISNTLIISSVTIQRVFPALTFSAPLDFQAPHDGSGRVFVVQQGGKIQAVSPLSNSATATTLLDLGTRTAQDGERGLLGLAIHPHFAQNGYIYVNYTGKNDGNSVISRFQANPANSSQIDPNTETVFLTQTQPFANHNGGGLAFGADGFLYIAFGDGGSGGDPMGNGQSRSTFLGKILRVDVDNPSGGRQYGIPIGNPFAGNSSGLKEEIFAYGFRNPFRFSFDSATGKLWAGDVGQDAREEVDIVSVGKNYGWNTMEGTACYNASTCNRFGLTLPVTDYTHDIGKAITGGYVYHGDGAPALQNRYVYGDFISGRLFSLDAHHFKRAPNQLADTDIGISSFGVDAAGELYLTSYSDGKIYRFVEQ